VRCAARRHSKDRFGSLHKRITALIGRNVKVLVYSTWLLFGLVGVAAETAPSGVVINIEPPKITRRTFDLQNPPKEMPKLTPPEVGTCVYSFGCTTEIVMRGKEGNPARISGIEVATRLTITLWTPHTGPPKIVAHEEGHREICEIYYQSAESIARRLAEREIGRQIPASVRGKQAAEAELKKIQDALLAAFLRQTADRCDIAQAHYDAITQHSIALISESNAITHALSEEQAAYARLSAAPLAGVSVDVAGQ
jgi:hypothetical protein